MENQYAYQFGFFVLSLVLGVLSGVLFDCFKINRSLNKSGVIKVLMQDIIYWLFNIFCIFTIGINSDNGIRAYEIFAFCFGIVIYKMTISKYFINFGTRLAIIIKNIMHLFLKILLFPIFLIMKLVGKPVLVLKLKILDKFTKIRLTLHNFWFKISRKVRLIFKFLRKG